MAKAMKPGQRVLAALRMQIASGDIADGARIAEIATAAALNVSRMPVRTALRALEQEGLVVKLGARGYAARAPSPAQICDAIEVRGVLEGLAARRLAERSMDGGTRKNLDACLAEGDAIFADDMPSEGAMERFYDYNRRFHDLLIAASGNGAIGVALSRNNHLPFASATAFAIGGSDVPGERAHLLAAHHQHRAVVAAILAGDGDQAEQIMRGHARMALTGPGIVERLGIETQQAPGVGAST
ncbi:GntR family transcriptional regulator [Sphingobium algorifonticola]|uniref:GntR family transcriptional regulator n=1 Tax=Sphingobium algorifonticola TaxID=2008318 RepID=A0A437J4H4_9SPHN|nr:GntR family transcriptional regulator [Sphingobium algorifonticola]RVT39457.1 GntR family transcriptional regulator [Sphingobium algorifonticola]